MDNQDSYTIPAQLMQATINTLMSLPGTQGFGLLYSLKNLCDAQDREKAENAFDARVSSAVYAATAGVQRA